MTGTLAIFLTSAAFVCGLAVCAMFFFGEITIQHKKARNAAQAERDALQVERDGLQVERDDLDSELKLHRTPGHDIAQNVDWRSNPLMNKSEFALYRALNDIVAQSPNNHRLFSQVAYGAFLAVCARRGPERLRRAAFHAVARKSADFVIINRYGYPVAVVEYQGTGHYQANAHDRDQAKRVACHSAGIPFIEVGARGLSDGQRRDLLARLTDRPKVVAE